MRAALSASAALSRLWGLFAATALLAVVSTSGCTAVQGPAANPFEERRVSRIRLDVINNNFNDATLYAYRGPQRQRLGVVTGKTSATYTIDWPQSQQLRVEISLLTGGSCTTNTIQVDPGNVVELQIRDDFVRGSQCQDLRPR
jgi:outer membrane biogenesis lipoprotein LolB